MKKSNLLAFDTFVGALNGSLFGIFVLELIQKFETLGSFKMFLVCDNLAAHRQSLLVDALHPRGHAFLRRNAFTLVPVLISHSSFSFSSEASASWKMISAKFFEEMWKPTSNDECVPTCVLASVFPFPQPHWGSVWGGKSKCETTNSTPPTRGWRHWRSPSGTSRCHPGFDCEECVKWKRARNDFITHCIMVPPFAHLSRSLSLLRKHWLLNDELACVVPFFWFAALNKGKEKEKENDMKFLRIFMIFWPFPWIFASFEPRKWKETK